MRATKLLWLAPLLGACLFPLGGDKKKDGGNGGTPGQDDAGECVGQMANPTTYSDSSSCFLQHGIWRGYPDHDCEGNYSNQCSDAHSYSESDLRKRDCIGRIGCTYVAKDGTESQNPYLGGSCSGNSAPCEWLRDKATCDLQGSACHWRDEFYTALPNTCERNYPYVHVDGIYECDQFVPSPSLHPEVAHGYCLDRIGCKWTNADGSIEKGPKSDLVIDPPGAGGGPSSVDMGSGGPGPADLLAPAADLVSGSGPPGGPAPGPP